MVLEIPAYDSYYEVVPVKMCQAQEIGNPRMWNPPPLRGALSPPHLLQDLLSFTRCSFPDPIQFSLLCNSIDPTIQGCFVQN